MKEAKKFSETCIVFNVLPHIIIRNLHSAACTFKFSSFILFFFGLSLLYPKRVRESERSRKKCVFILRGLKINRFLLYSLYFMKMFS